MKVSDVMTQYVSSCTMNDSLARAAEIMWEGDCGCVPILDAANRVVGMVTDRDVCMGALSQNRPLTDIRISQVATMNVSCVNENDSIDSAESAMQMKQVRRIPVVDDKGELRGIVSLNDLARRAMATSSSADGLSRDDVMRTLVAISNPHRRIIESAVEIPPDSYR